MHDREQKYLAWKKSYKVLSVAHRSEPNSFFVTFVLADTAEKEEPKGRDQSFRVPELKSGASKATTTKHFFKMFRHVPMTSLPQGYDEKKTRKKTSFFSN